MNAETRLFPIFSLSEINIYKLWNSVQIESVREQSTEQNISTEETESSKMLWREDSHILYWNWRDV
jgi:hypothetical protein